MRIITKKVSDDLGNIYGYKYLNKTDFMIFDIETTGFSRQYDIIYMIGCIYKTKEGLEYCNVFAQDPSEEGDLIEYFFKLLENIDCTIHFNGNQFDIPFLLARASKHGIKDQISHLASIDVYGLLRPFRKSLDYPDLKLDTIQAELGYKRKDLYSGGDMIPIYHLYTEKAYEPYYELLLLHNEEDVEGMINLFPIIDMIYLIDDLIAGESISLVETKEDQGKIVLSFKLPRAAAMDFNLDYNEIGQLEFKANSNHAQLIIPLHRNSKKFFFENYQDYMYLPARDEVIHQSIASFIPASQRERAKKAQCYVEQTGLFMPVFLSQSAKDLKLRVFKDDLRSKEEYVLVSEEFQLEFYQGQMIGFLMKCKGL